MEEPDVLTLKEAAAFLRCHQSTVYRMLKRNELPHFRIGSDYRFTRSTLQGWIDKQQQESLAC